MYRCEYVPCTLFMSLEAVSLQLSEYCSVVGDQVTARCCHPPSLQPYSWCYPEDECGSLESRGLNRTEMREISGMICEGAAFIANRTAKLRCHRGDSSSNSVTLEITNGSEWL